MPPKGHAVLSASSSERWLNCPPSARLCEAYEDKGSDYAAEGTDAHTLCEYRLKQALGIPAEDPIQRNSIRDENHMRRLRRLLWSEGLALERRLPQSRVAL